MQLVSCADYVSAKAAVISPVIRVPFDLTIEYLEEIWPAGNRCPVCEAPFVREKASLCPELGPGCALQKDADPGGVRAVPSWRAHETCGAEDLGSGPGRGWFCARSQRPGSLMKVPEYEEHEHVLNRWARVCARPDAGCREILSANTAGQDSRPIRLRDDGRHE